MTILHCWKEVIFPMRSISAVLPPGSCAQTVLIRARHTAFFPGWIHKECNSSLQAKVNPCSSWERIHQQGKSLKTHLLGVIVSEFLKFYASKSLFSFFPSQLLPCWAPQEGKWNVEIETYARLKKTPFTLTNDCLASLSCVCNRYRHNWLSLLQAY